MRGKPFFVCSPERLFCFLSCRNTCISTKYYAPGKRWLTGCSMRSCGVSPPQGDVLVYAGMLMDIVFGALMSHRQLKTRAEREQRIEHIRQRLAIFFAWHIRLISGHCSITSWIQHVPPSYGITSWPQGCLFNSSSLKPVAPKATGQIFIFSYCEPVKMKCRLVRIMQVYLQVLWV